MNRVQGKHYLLNGFIALCLGTTIPVMGLLISVIGLIFLSFSHFASSLALSDAEKALFHLSNIGIWSALGALWARSLQKKTYPLKLYLLLTACYWMGIGLCLGIGFDAFNPAHPLSISNPYGADADQSMDLDAAIPDGIFNLMLFLPLLAFWLGHSVYYSTKALVSIKTIGKALG